MDSGEFSNHSICASMMILMNRFHKNKSCCLPAYLNLKYHLNVHYGVHYQGNRLCVGILNFELNICLRNVRIIQIPLSP